MGLRSDWNVIEALNKNDLFLCLMESYCSKTYYCLLSNKDHIEFVEEYDTLDAAREMFFKLVVQYFQQYENYLNHMKAIDETMKELPIV